MRKMPSEDYLKKAMLLTKEESERLLARMRGKLARRLEDRKLTALQCVAMQLEIEDEELKEWRKNMAAIRKRTKAT